MQSRKIFIFSVTHPLTNSHKSWLSVWLPFCSLWIIHAIWQKARHSALRWHLNWHSAGMPRVSSWCRGSEAEITQAARDKCKNAQEFKQDAEYRATRDRDVIQVGEKSKKKDKEMPLWWLKQCLGLRVPRDRKRWMWRDQHASFALPLPTQHRADPPAAPPRLEQFSSHFIQWPKDVAPSLSLAH